MGENTYISNLRSKLTKLHIFLKQNPKNIKTNAFHTNVVHLWFASSQIFNLFKPICSCNILHIIYDKNR
jgi:hypothetical protein